MGRFPLLYVRDAACYIKCMTKTTEPTLYSFSFCLEDCRRIVDALRCEAYNLKQESDRACEKGSREYGTLLWEETAILNSIAETIDWVLPE